MQAQTAAGPALVPRAGEPAAAGRRSDVLPAPGPRFRHGDRIGPGLFACKLLGGGRQTECWLTWSVPLWSHVVVKLPRPEHVGDPLVARRLRREALALARLSHPSVQRLLQDANDQPVPHLVLTYVDGPNLAELLDAEGPLPPGDVVRLGLDLAACLHHVHGRGYVHLDVEPGNVVLRDGRAVLLDFDGARPAGGPPPPGRPRAGCYTAPEQRRRERPDPRMDLFGMGAVLYELATGVPPFRVADAVPGCPHPQLAASPPRARALRPGLPIDVDFAVHALLELDPRRRPATALEALRLLAAALPPAEERGWPAFADELLETT